jgi:hypothetical protein
MHQLVINTNPSLSRFPFEYETALAGGLGQRSARMGFIAAQSPEKLDNIHPL